MTTPTVPGMHDCPGCDAPNVPRHHLACRPCNAVNGSYYRRISNPAAHRRAIVAAMAWYREHRP